MTRTPEEIKKGLECRLCDEPADLCGEDCPCWSAYSPREMYEDKDVADALALIQQLQAENAEKAERIQQLESERDAAVDTIYEMAKCIMEDGNYSVCMWCDQTECERLCMTHLTERPGFKWRGVTKEE